MFTFSLTDIRAVLARGRADAAANTKRLMSAVPVPDPERRRIKNSDVVEELKSPIRPVDYKIVPMEYRQVSPGHLVAES